MGTLLITGGAGFIGSNLVHYALDHTADQLVVLDKLTYAGSLLNLDGALNDPARDVRAGRHRRCRRGRARVRGASADRGPQPGGRDARRSLDRRPPSVHRHQHRRHLRAARGGADVSSPASMPAARAAFRFLHVSTDEVYGTLGAMGLFTEETPVRAELAVRGEQGGRRSSGARQLPHLRPAGADHQLLEQLRAVPVSGEADSADDAQRARRPAAAGLRRRRQRARLAARRGPLRRHPARAGARDGSARSTTSAAATSAPISRSSIASATRSTAAPGGRQRRPQGSPATAI